MNRAIYGIAFILVIGLTACDSSDHYVEGLPDKIDFNFHVRPILSNNCFTCHGPDSSSREAGLRLDILEGATAKNEEGRAAIVPGNAEKSLLLARITSHDPDQQMPPPKMNKVLSEREVALIAKWIDQGAEWKKHWAFVSPEKPDLPRKIRKQEPNEIIDYLIDKELSQRDLLPAAQAERTILIRRLSYLTTGLPPSPERVEAFVNDSSEVAWANLVDEYLASPHFGERWARHWMDLVRYAETMGHEFDYGVSDAWAYRDYLIRAFNQDVPYNQFVKEHLAGDMLEQPRLHPIDGTNESVLATAYAYMGEGKHSPVSIKQEEADRIDNMIDVTSKTFLGMTVGCARCHDHKFDPIPTTDYYAMYGMFESSRFAPISIDITPDKLQNISKIEELNQQLRFELGKQWAADIQTSQPIATKVHFMKEEPEPMTNSEDIEYKIIADFRCESEDTFREKGWKVDGQFIHDGLMLSKESTENVRIQPKQLRLEAYRMGKAEALRSPNFTIEDDFIEMKAAGNRGTIRLVIDNFQLIQFPIYGDIQKTIENPEMNFYRMNVAMWKGHKAYLEFVPGRFDRHVYQVKPEDFIAVEYVFSYSGEKPSEQQIEIPPCEQTQITSDFATLKKTIKSWIDRKANPQQADQLNQLITEGKLSAPSPEIHRLISEIDSLKNTTYDQDYIFGLNDGPAVKSSVFIRGSVNQLSEEKVPHQYLFALTQANDSFPQANSGRLTWAEKTVNPDNPLAARVMVNRLWHHIFNRGIVETVDNFGLQGKLPTHPELLDYLALTFIEKEWSVKQMIRAMLLTKAFQRSTKAPEQNANKDPNNDYLAHFRVKRMEGEAIRDAMLAVSGCLDSTMFGASVPVHLTKFMSGRGRPPASGALDGEGRRSIYISIRRNFLSPWMLTFDMPMPFSTFGKRNISNVPAQSLTLMNDPFVREMAINWAHRLGKENEEIEKRVIRIYWEAFSRNPSLDEIQAAKVFLDAQAESYEISPEDIKSNITIWADYCHTIFNLKEFIHLI